jgi:hypothetical protein
VPISYTYRATVVFDPMIRWPPGLLLADGELTMRDIIAAGFTALAETRLALLSACQTAIQDFRNLPDEAIGLPAGFTQAGVPLVLGTLRTMDGAGRGGKREDDGRVRAPLEQAGQGVVVLLAGGPFPA